MGDMTLYEHMQKVSRSIFEGGQTVEPFIMLKDKLGKIKAGDAQDFFLQQNKGNIKDYLRELIKSTNAIEISIITEAWVAKVYDPAEIDMTKSLALQDVPQRGDALTNIYFNPHGEKVFLAEIDRKANKLGDFEEMPSNLCGNLANLHTLFKEY